MKVLAILAGFSLAAGAPAAQPNAVQMNNGMPPERFRGNSVSIVVFTDRAGIDEMCGVAPPPSQIIACARRLNEGTPLIVMPNPNTYTGPHDYQVIMAHEVGHTNGWPGDHPE